MFDFYIICKLCGKEEIHGWHPIWQQKKICYPCQDKMYKRHKVLMDKILENNKPSNSIAKRGDKMKCCLCNKKIEAKGSWTEGNNALPIKNGRCCDDCNATKVIPARLTRVTK